MNTILGNKKNLTKAINNISFEVDKGEFVGIMGPSGSGKTTLLNCIATIDKVTTGAIKIDGKDITTLSRKNIEKFRRENLGFIFQDFNLFRNNFHKINPQNAFTASYCKRILFIKDGKIFNELIRGNDSRKEFFKRILEVVTLLGGDCDSVI